MRKYLFVIAFAVLMGGCDPETLAALERAAASSGSTAAESNAQPVQYSRAYLTNVWINQVPFVQPDGTGWDMTSGPDFLFEIKDENQNVLWTRSAVYEDANPSHFPQGYPINRPLMISDWNARFALVVWDKDVTEPDFVGVTIPFSVAELARNGYPTTVDLFNNEISARLTLTYE